MPLPQPLLDDSKYDQLRDELVQRIPVHSPKWADFNASDPGVTLVALFTFLTESLLRQIDDHQRQRRRRRRLAFLVVGTAAIGLCLWSWGRVRPQPEDCDPQGSA